MIAKVHFSDGRKLVAVCDEVILGKKFEENDLQIDLTGNYYKGEKVNEEKLVGILKGAYAASFAGKDSVNFGIGRGVIKKENVKSVAGVPNAQSFAID